MIEAKSHSSLFILNFIVFGFHEDGNNHEDKAEEANEWSYHDTTCAEDVGIERFFCCSVARHEDEANNYNQESHDEEDVVELAKCKIIFHIFLIS